MPHLMGVLIIDDSTVGSVDKLVIEEICCEVQPVNNAIVVHTIINLFKTSFVIRNNLFSQLTAFLFIFEFLY